MPYWFKLLLFCSALAGLAGVCLRLDLEGRLTRIPFAFLVSVDYLVFYGLLPAYSHFRPSFELVYPPEIQGSTMMFVVAAVAIMTASYYGALSLDRRPPEPPVPEVPAWDRLVGWGALGFSCLYNLIPAMGRLPSLSQLERPAWFVGSCLIGYALAAGSLGRGETRLFIAVTVLKIMVLTGAVFLYGPIVSCTILITVMLVWRRWKATLALVAVIGCLMLSYIPIKYAYNRFHNTTAFTAGSHVEVGRGLFRPLASLDLVARRSVQGLLLQHVIDRTPAEVPYWGGSTVSMLATNLVPRVFWPEKPQERLGQAFGRAYGILHPEDTVTSWNVPWLVELYMNFGYGGALAGMAAAGACLGTLIRLGGGGRRLTGRAFGLTAGLCLPLFHQESNISLMAGNLPWLMVLFSLAFVLSRHLAPHLGWRTADVR